MSSISLHILMSQRTVGNVAGKPDSEKPGAWIVRNVPAELMRRTRMAALAERTTVRELLMKLVQDHLAELEKKGVLPRPRGQGRPEGM
jgi:hypothetical protein